MGRIITAIKEFLKRFLPPPVRAFNREVERILGAVAGGRRETAALRSQLQGQQRELAELRQRLEDVRQERLVWETEQCAAWTAALERMLAAQGEQWEKKLAPLYMEQQELLDYVKQLNDGGAALEERISGRIAALGGQTAALLEGQKAAREQAAKQAHAMDMLGQKLAEEADSRQTELQEAHKELRASVEHAKRALAEGVEKTRRQAAEASRHASEAVWGHIFNNAVSESMWLRDKAFAPGRWAVGYPYLYVMYRVLNEARPKRILELGLGQSTRMIAQYAAAFDDVEHIVVEHDQEWIDFFSRDFQLSERSRIVRLEREMVPYKEAEAVRVFQGFREVFQGERFDFISIDAPLGADMKQYARIDVLGLMPNCLAEDFVIMVDDTERSGETNTLMEMETCLKEAQIAYRRGRYSGKKDCIVICAEQVGFLSSV